ncbi:glycosyltransferase [Aureivirga sp. CE67]|uniref:glycosyltransferase n=1 Tax=Aureivirga sp. CE67 TaxID=1788983 RepID=UPI0018C99374|nr:glycosyltransferase [Aureivirga sp. CE67]
MNTEHIYLFSYFDLESASTRYRANYPLQYFLENYGISYDFIYPDRSFRGKRKFLKTYLEALFFQKKNSFIIIQKTCSNSFYAKLLKLLTFFKHEKVIFDIDDAEQVRFNLEDYRYFLEKSKAITVGSKELLKFHKQFNENVHFITTPVVEHKVLKEKRNEKLTVGWLGDFGNGNNTSVDFSHKKNMYDLFFEGIRKIEIPIILKIVGVKVTSDINEIREYFKENPNIELQIPENLKWKEDIWVYEEIKTFDVGVYPLNNHVFSISKSVFKAKQYLSVGVPTLASNEGDNEDFITDNENGFLCENSDDFLKYIYKIQKMNDEKYTQMVDTAIDRKSDFSMKKYCDAFLKIMNNN